MKERKEIAYKILQHVQKVLKYFAYDPRALDNLDVCKCLGDLSGALMYAGIWQNYSVAELQKVLADIENWQVSE